MISVKKLAKFAYLYDDWNKEGWEDYEIISRSNHFVFKIKNKTFQIQRRDRKSKFRLLNTHMEAFCNDNGWVYYSNLIEKGYFFKYLEDAIEADKATFELLKPLIYD